MNEDTLDTSIRQFLKTFGVSAQRERPCGRRLRKEN